MCYLRTIIMISFLLPSIVEASFQIMGEVAYQCDSDTEPRAYVDFVVSDSQLLGTNSRSFIYGTESEYSLSQWYYFYQIEYPKPANWDDPDYINPHIELDIKNLNADNILSVGFVNDAVDFDNYFNHFFDGEQAESDILGGNPSYGMFMDLNIHNGNGDIISSFDYYLIYISSGNIDSFSPILFISSSEPPVGQESAMAITISQFIGAFPEAYPTTGNLPAPQQNPSTSSVSEPFGLFLFGLFILPIFRKKKTA